MKSDHGEMVPHNPTDCSSEHALMTRAEFTRLIDHTALKPETTKDEIRRVCEEAGTFGFGAVCVAPLWVPFATRCLAGSPVRIATVIGFPHGNTLPDAKAYEAKLAIEAGAHELDMVIQIGLLRAGNHGGVLDDIQGVVNVAHRDIPSKNPGEGHSRNFPPE